MTDLSSLIERLEKATGPDRGIDAEIMFDIFATPVGKHKVDDGPIGYIRLDDQPSWNLGLRFPGKNRVWFDATRKQIKGETLLIERDGAFVLMNSMRIPELTASIDAAVSLAERVLPGWRIATEHGENYSAAKFRRGWGARLQTLGAATSERADDKIALCIAAATVRALQSKGDA